MKILPVTGLKGNNYLSNRVTISQWAFKRYLGLQEPASVLFSFLNGFAVFLGISNLVAKVPVTYVLFHTWLGYGIVSKSFLCQFQRALFSTYRSKVCCRMQRAYHYTSVSKFGIFLSFRYCVFKSPFLIPLFLYPCTCVLACVESVCGLFLYVLLK